MFLNIACLINLMLKRGVYCKIFIAIIIVIYMLILVQSRNPLIVDDVAPLSSCDELIKKADIIYVIPLENNNSISNYLEWCKNLQLLNKTIGLHGIRHNFHEFDKEVSEVELIKATSSFEKCFGEKPKLFRPPENLISEENIKKITSLNMTIYRDSYLKHSYCHCNPKSWLKVLNWFIWCQKLPY